MTGDSHMPITNQDFQLSDKQLEDINRYFEARASGLARSGDHILCPTLNVHFSFAPVFGRSVEVSYDSETTSHEIECQWTDSP